jgi:hypothetical protein
MNGSITLQPQVLDLSLYAGDGIAFKIICTGSDDAPINITGTVESQVRIAREDTDPLTEFGIDLTEADEGKVSLSLTGDQTQLLLAAGSKGKFSGVWDVQWVPTGSEPRTLCQGKVDVHADVTR